MTHTTRVNTSWMYVGDELRWSYSFATCEQDDPACRWKSPPIGTRNEAEIKETREFVRELGLAHERTPVRALFSVLTKPRS